MERILKIENSGRTTKLTLAGIDFSSCICGVTFDHYGQCDSPTLALKNDQCLFSEIIARCSDENLTKAASEIQEYVEYYRAYFAVNEICRPE